MEEAESFIWLWLAPSAADETRASLFIAAADLPPAHRPKFSALSTHLFNAVYPLSAMLSDRRHINLATKQPFDCINYITDDPNAQACCTHQNGTHAMFLGIGFVRRLVKIAHLLEPTLAARPRMGGPLESPGEKDLKQNAELTALISGDATVSEKEAADIAEGWPAATDFGLQIDLSGFALFYDLIRLVCMHEWAHALCGHVAMVQHELQMMRLHEFSTERSAARPASDVLQLPCNEILQSIELHADEFAIRSCAKQLLWGHDPVGQIAGPRIDLVDRLLMLNTASSIFAIMWALAESKFAPGETWRPTRSNVSGASTLFQITPSTHPPADLRYMRFRDFQRDNAMQYGLSNGAPQLGTMTDAHSLKMVETMTRSCGYFDHLMGITPMVLRTPTMKSLIAYETHLLDVGAALAPHIGKFAFIPTDPKPSTPTQS